MIFVSLLFNLFHSFFFFNNLSEKTNIREAFALKNFFPRKSINAGHFLPKQTLTASKSDLNWILYSWLTSSKININTQILTNLFESHVNKNWWVSNYDFFIKLYKLTFLTDLFYENKNLKNLKITFFNDNFFFKSLIYINNNISFNNSIKFFLWFDLFNCNSQSVRKLKINNSINNLKTRYVWNLYNFNSELAQHSFLLKTKTGLFYLNNFNYDKFNNLIFNFQELWNLNFFVKNQLNTAKWNRWLYRYSILHRKILKNSHKLTIVKKTLNSGFYDNNFFNKNIWNSEHFSKNITQNSAFSAMSSMYYQEIYSNLNQKNPLIGHVLLTNNSSQTKSLSLLSFHENSYFWFLKRFYFFNTLPSNFIYSKTKKIKNKINNECDVLTSKNNNLNKYYIFSSYLLKSNLNNFITLNNDYNASEYSINLPNPSTIKATNSYFLKDIYLLLDENDFFNKNNLNTLVWLTSNNSANKNLNFFSGFLNYNSQKFITNQKLSMLTSKNTASDLYNLNTLLFKSLIDLNTIYREDAHYFTMFY